MSVEKKIKELDKAIKIRTKQLTPVEKLSYDRQIDKLKTNTSESGLKLKEALRIIDSLEQRVESLLYINENKKPFVIEQKHSLKDSESTGLLLAGDWHVDENINPDKIGGVNAYNPDIARKRAIKFFSNGLLLINIQRGGVKIDNLVLALLGDFISGHIHPDLIQSNYLAPLAAKNLAFELIVSGIQMLLKEGDFKHIIVPCVDGNHGRTTEKQRINTRTDNSFETDMYRFIAREFKSEKRIEFQIAEGQDISRKIYDMKVRFHHGDLFNYQGGILGMGVNAAKGIMGLNTTGQADLDIHGHWHTTSMDTLRISNGSLIGYSPFARKIKAKFEPPMQTMALINSKRGLNGYFKIFVEDTIYNPNKNYLNDVGENK